jgi:hypothetical protein
MSMIKCLVADTCSKIARWETLHFTNKPRQRVGRGHLISPTNARWDIQILSEVPIPTWCKYFQLVPLLEINIMPTVSRS